jgi:hypothetical protein
LDNLSNDEQIAVLRGLTKRTEILHEAQVLQLRLWPFAVDPSLSNSEASIDFPTHQVSFAWKDTDKSQTWKATSKYLSGIDRLQESVRFLLGNGWKISVSMNGKKFFPPTKKSKPKKTKKKPDVRRTRRK